MHSNFQTLYEQRVMPAREHFLNTPWMQELLSPQIAPTQLLLFLIYYHALGVQMTEPVEGWIRRAGERCEELDLLDLGRALKLHAHHETNHHLLMIEDTHYLIEQWHLSNDSKLEPESIFNIPPTAGVFAYTKLHEEAIASDTPYSQLAIEYELENLSIGIGPILIQHCKCILGPQVLEGLTFLREHIALDIGHTKFNKAQLDKLLTYKPCYADPLCLAGSMALDAYSIFLNDCMTLAKTAGDRQVNTASTIETYPYWPQASLLHTT